MKTIKIIYNIFSTVLIAVIILITLLAVLLGISGMDKDNPKSILGFRSFIVMSDSMTPVFDKGSLIIIKETKADKLKVGDIITFRPANPNDETLHTHRIVKIDGEGENIKFTARGEASNANDNPVSPEMVFGKVVFYMDGLGTFIINLRTPLGIFCMIAVIAVGLFLLPYLIALPESKKKKSGKNGLIKDIENDNINKDKDGDGDKN